MRSLTTRRPDDWHVHFRDGPVLAEVARFTAAVFARAVVMPNLVPPVTDAAAAAAYRRRILEALPAGLGFTPLMTCYLTDATDPADLVRGHAEGVFFAAKLYPAHATTNAQFGVSSIARIRPVLEAMERHGVPLCIHGEMVRDDIDVFDREARFIELVLLPLLAEHPGLRVVLEHVTTEEGVAIVRAHRPRLGATITPQHLLFNRNAIFAGGLRPHMYCLPVLKRERHRLALRAAATSGEPGFFLGTDSAPHLRHLKESGCGCAGIYSAPVAMPAYLRVFAEENALDRLEAFASLNGPAFHGLPPNDELVTFEAAPHVVPAAYPIHGEGEVLPLFAGEDTGWRLRSDNAAAPD